MRRMETSAVAPSADVRRVRFGPFEMDFSSGEVLKGGRPAHLPPQPFRILEMLVRRPGDVVTREEIKERLWSDGTVVDFDQGLNSCIYQIRALLNDDADVPRFLETVPRRGYRWLGPVEVLVADSATGRADLHLVEGAREPPPALADARRGAHGFDVPKLLPRLHGAVTVLAVGAAVYFALPRTPESPVWKRVTFQRGLVTSARFGMGGEIVYAAAWGTADRTTLRRARPPVLAEETADETERVREVVGVAPDGEVAYFRLGPAGGRELVRRPATGGAKVVAQDVLVGDWNGRDFAVVRQVGAELQLEYPMERVLDKVARVRSIRISPDGTRVALTEHPLINDDAGKVVVYDREGRRSVWGGDWGSLQGLAWSPRGDEVWFTATREGADLGLYAAGPGGRVRTVVPATGRLVLQDISSDGRVLVDRSNFRTGTAFVRAGEPERDLSWFDGSAVVALSRDGRRMLFTETAEAGGASYGVYLRGTDGEGAMRLGEGRALDLSPDGRWALVMPARHPDRLLLMPTGPGEQRTLLDSRLTSHRWGRFLPHGESVLFAAEEKGGKLGLFEQRIDGSEARRIVSDFPATVPAGIVSPDGRFVVSRCPEPCLQPLDGGSPRPLPALQGLEEGWWGANGRIYARLVRRPPVSLFEIVPETNERRDFGVIRPADPVGLIVGGVVGTPDGRAWAYWYTRRLSEIYEVTGLFAGAR
jgi:DNA-binding winged helix-turn-helix (wHTH) protein